VLEAREFAGWTCGENSRFERLQARAEDGAQLQVYRTQPDAGLPALVFANALGSPARVLEAFAHSVKDRLSLVTWDARCMPGPGLADFSRITPAVHARDLVRVLDFCKLQSSVVAGWCTGAETVLEAARWAPSRISLALLLNGDYSFRTQKNGEKGALTKALFREIVAHPEEAPTYFEMLRRSPVARSCGDGAEEDAQLLELVSAPARVDPEKLHRFAVMSNSFWSNSIEDWVAEVACECHAFGAVHDVVAHVDSSRRISELLRDCSLEIRPQMSHFSICYDSALHDRLASLTQTRYERGVPTPELRVTASSSFY